MATKLRSRIYVRTEDGSATKVSARRGSPTAPLCRRHRIGDLRDAKAVGLLPAFVDVEALTSEVDRVVRTGTFDEDAARRVAGEGPIAEERVRRARVAEHALRLRAAAVAATIEPQVAEPARVSLAGKAVKILTSEPFDIVRFELDDDLDLYTDLVFGSDVHLASFGELRIFRGAALVSSSSSFTLRATKVQGDLLRPLEVSADDVALLDHVARF